MLLWAWRTPDQYAAAMQEDRVVEWWTTALFATAGVIHLTRAVRRRRVFDGLVGLFCLFVAGEEISWGQRLLGFTPPAPFLARNTQQEFNLHNFTDLLGKPKWLLAMALVGYGVLLPLVARTSTGQAVLRRIGAHAPVPALAPWFAVAVALLAWYPVEFTGEWVECLAGFLFVVAMVSPWRSAGLAIGATLAAAFGLAAFSAHGGAGDPARVACARSEASALLSDLLGDGTVADDLVEGGTIHKRVWTAAADGYLELDRAVAFQSARCAGAAAADAPGRRRYAVDPWGTAYWIKTLRSKSGTESSAGRVLVYSFGPNRRRDGNADDAGGDRHDDVVVLESLSLLAR